MSSRQSKNQVVEVNTLLLLLDTRVEAAFHPSRHLSHVTLQGSSCQQSNSSILKGPANRAKPSYLKIVKSILEVVPISITFLLLRQAPEIASGLPLALGSLNDLQSNRTNPHLHPNSSNLLNNSSSSRCSGKSIALSFITSQTIAMVVALPCSSHSLSRPMYLPLDWKQPNNCSCKCDSNLSRCKLSQSPSLLGRFT